MASGTILVAAGPRPGSDDALALAVALARLREARLLLVGVYVSPFGPGDGRYETVLRGEGNRLVDELRAGVPGDVEADGRTVGATSVVRGLHTVAEEVGADMLVIGPSRLGDVARALRGDITLGAIHAAPCAVAVAPPGHAQRAADAPPRRIGVAYDGSAEAEQALAMAADLAQRAGADAALRIVEVLDAPYVFQDPPVVDHEGLHHYLRSVAEEVRGRLDAARATVAERVAATSEMPEGPAVAELLRAAADLDLLVMGSRAYGPLRRVLLGSVASGVLRDAPCPVLVVPRGT